MREGIDQLGGKMANEVIPSPVPNAWILKASEVL